MPKLAGKKSNSALYAGFGLLIAAIGAVALEYFGVIDLVPNLGKETEVKITSTNQSVKTINTVNLDSLYTETSTMSLGDLRTPESSKAALS